MGIEIGLLLNACNDGIDNDNDGLIDSEDLGCVDGFDFSEADFLINCKNGLDDNGNTWRDENDIGCIIYGDENYSAHFASGCSNNADENGDGTVDGNDPFCESLYDNMESSTTGSCDDNVDGDNDGWPDDVELDRGSGIFDPESTPFNMYMEINSGFFYRGGLSGDSFTSEYDPESFEISLSALSEIVFEELVIPLLLVPIYFAIFFARRSEFRKCLKEIEDVSNLSELIELEKTVNRMVKERTIKVYHGLVLRNALEEKESEFGLEPQYESKSEEE